MLRRETAVPVRRLAIAGAVLGAWLTTLLAVAGCGQKGPLYLPTKPAPTPAATAPGKAAPVVEAGNTEQAGDAASGEPHRDHHNDDTEKDAENDKQVEPARKDGPHAA